MDRSVLSLKLGQENPIFTPNWTLFTGYSIEELAEKWTELVHPDDSHHIERPFVNSRQFDLRLRRHDGQYRWFFVHALFKDPIISMVFIDIEDRKQIHNEYCLQHEFLSLITNSIHAFLGYIDIDEKFRYANESYEELCGKPKEFICGSKVFDVLGEENYKKIQFYLHLAFKGKKQKFCLALTIQNSQKLMSFSFVPHFDDGSKINGVFVLSEFVENLEIHDLETFIMSMWANNQNEFCSYIGKAIAQVGIRKLPDIFLSIGLAYFSLNYMCNRIDYLYEHYEDRIGGQKRQIAKEMVDIEVSGDDEEKIVCVCGKGGRHKNIKLMLLRDELDKIPYYSLRYFVGKEEPGDFLKRNWHSSLSPIFKNVLAELPEPYPPRYQDNCEFWNFCRHEEEIAIYPKSMAFYDLDETKSVADLVILASNFVGFKS